MNKLSNIPRFEDWMEKTRDARFCGNCKNWFLDPANRIHIEQTTMCLQCEHIEADKNAQADFNFENNLEETWGEVKE